MTTEITAQPESEGRARTEPDHPASDRPARIVVGVDGSVQSVLALRWAARLAAPLGARLQVVSAWAYPEVWGFDGVIGDWDFEGQWTTLANDAIADAFGDARPVGLTVQVSQGNAAAVLLAAAVGATMLVVGSRGHGGFSGMLLGSVSANVAEHAGCPVLVVHGDLPPTTG